MAEIRPERRGSIWLSACTADRLDPREFGPVLSPEEREVRPGCQATGYSCADRLENGLGLTSIKSEGLKPASDRESVERNLCCAQTVWLTAGPVKAGIGGACRYHSSVPDRPPPTGPFQMLVH